MTCIFVVHRLWAQARAQGVVAARSMVAQAAGTESLPTDSCFDLFAHVTRFFGFKVVLLGCFNGQTLSLEGQREFVKSTAPPPLAVDPDSPPQVQQLYTAVYKYKAAAAAAACDDGTVEDQLEVWIRQRTTVDFVKLVVFNSVIIGGVLIGDTDLEETIENLIMTGLKVDCKILEADCIDLEDYFD